MNKIKEKIIDFRERLTNMLVDSEINDDKVYKLSIKLDELILEYQKNLNKAELK